MADDPNPLDVNELFNQFGDVFGNFFGDAGSTGRAGSKGADISSVLELTLLEASDGATREITIPRDHGCATCERAGAQPSGITKCGTCDGAGQTSAHNGDVNLVATCTDCEGRGGTITTPCSDCEGKGVSRLEESLTVKVPAGIQPGQVLRLAGKGSVGSDGTAGNVYLTIEVTPDSGCAREGADLFVVVTLEPGLARAGGMAEAYVPGDSILIEVPAGTETGATLSMPGFGAQRLGAPATPRPKGDAVPYRSVDASDHRGELIVCFVIKGDPLPKAATERLSARASSRTGRPPLPDADLPPAQPIPPRVVAGALFVAALVVAYALLRH